MSNAMQDDQTWAERHYQAHVLGGLREYLKTGSDEDREYMIDQINALIDALGKRRKVEPGRVITIKRLVGTQDLPALLDKGTMAWDTLFAAIHSRVEGAVDEQLTNGTGFDDQVKAAPVIARSTTSAVGATAILREAFEKAVETELPQSSKVLNDFFLRRTRAKSAIYRMIEAAPERHRLLIALLFALGPDRFEAFMEMYAGEDLHIPGPKDSETFDRNREILQQFNQGRRPEKIGKTFGLSASRVYQIVAAERKGLRGDIKATRALLVEVNRVRKALHKAYVAEALHRTIPPAE